MWGFFGSIVVGWMQARAISKQAEKLFKAGAALFLSCHVAFWFTLGTVGGTALAQGSPVWVAVATGFFAACISVALAALAIYRRHPELFGNAAIAVPDQAVEKLQGEEGFTTITPKGDK